MFILVEQEGEIKEWRKRANTKFHVAVDARGIPLMIVTSDGVLLDNQKAE